MVYNFLSIRWPTFHGTFNLFRYLTFRSMRRFSRRSC